MDITWDALPTDRFNLRVAALVVDTSKAGESRVLVGRTTREDHWHFPGGRFQLRETAELALLREMREELALTPAGWSLRLVAENVFDSRRKDGSSFVCTEVGFYFDVELDQADAGHRALLAQPTDTDFDGNPDEDVVLRWVNVSGLGDIDLRPVLVRDAFEELPQGVSHLHGRSISPQ